MVSAPASQSTATRSRPEAKRRTTMSAKVVLENAQLFTSVQAAAEVAMADQWAEYDGDYTTAQDHDSDDETEPVRRAHRLLFMPGSGEFGFLQGSAVQRSFVSTACCLRVA